MNKLRIQIPPLSPSNIKEKKIQLNLKKNYNNNLRKGLMFLL